MALRSRARRIISFALALAFGVSGADGKTLRLFVIGNSFSDNATHYLPELAKAGGHELILASARLGGSSLERHWHALEADLAAPGDGQGRIYAGKSLRELLGHGRWDVITFQQHSLLSSDAGSYRPFARQLCAYLRSVQPGAEIVLHQTWTYRSDATQFGQMTGGKNAANHREMGEAIRAAYREIARELGVRLIPTGAAFWRIVSDSRWNYQPDPAFKTRPPVLSALPDQTNSLYLGYHRDKNGSLALDTKHASVAGEYLGALVWYAFLFDESPEQLGFVPPALAPDFAVQLRKIAWQVVREYRLVNEERVRRGLLTPRGF